MTQPSPLPQGGPDEAWDECVRTGTWTIGLGTIAGAIGTVFLGTETPILVGTGVGVAWSINRCRKLFRDKEENDLKNCCCFPEQHPDSSYNPNSESDRNPISRPIPQPAPERFEKSRPEEKTPDEDECSVAEQENDDFPASPEDDSVCPPAEPIEEFKPESEEDECAIPAEEETIKATMPPECNIPIQEKTNEKCTCEPRPPIICTCPPPPSDLCTCNKPNPPQANGPPQKCANTNKFTWPPLLTFSNVKPKSKPICNCPSLHEEDPLCTCEDS